MTGTGTIPVDPPLRGRWTLGSFPQRVELRGRVFSAARFQFPRPGVVAQYREERERDSMHLLVHDDGTYEVSHADEANPDCGLVGEHVASDLPWAEIAVWGFWGA